VPCYELLGGKIRDRIRVYWSHCANLAHQSSRLVQPPISDLDGVKDRTRSPREEFTALKTNISLTMPASPGLAPGSRTHRSNPRSMSTEGCCAICACISKPSAMGRLDVDILLDLNFNAKTEGYLKILRAIADFDMFWIEIDSFKSLKRSAMSGVKVRTRSSSLRDAAGTCVANSDSLFPRAGDGCRDHRTHLERRVAIDEDRRQRRGARKSPSRRIIFYGPPSHMMNATLRACLTSVMETAYRTGCMGPRASSPTCRILLTAYLTMPDRPGWGTEPNEEALPLHPRRDRRTAELRSKGLITWDAIVGTPARWGGSVHPNTFGCENFLIIAAEPGVPHWF